MSNTGSLERFTQSTRDVVERAKASARRYKHTHITPEHLLLGMIEIKDVQILKCLKAAKATPEQIVLLVQHHLRPGNVELAEAELSFSERAKRVLESAKAECLRAQKKQIAPEHLLIGLAQVHNTVAGAVLAAVDLNPDVLRKQFE